MFANLKITTRLAIAFGALVALIVALAGFCISRFGAIHRDVEVVVSTRIPVMEECERGFAEANEFARVLRNLLLRQLDGADVLGQEDGRMTEIAARNSERLKALDAKITDSSARALFSQLNAARGPYLDKLGEVRRLVLHGHAGEAKALLYGDLRTSQTAYFDAWRALIDEEVRLAQADGAEATAAVDRARQASIGFAIAAVVLALIAGYGVSRSLARPINQCVEAAQRIAAGDTEVELATGGKDELGQLLTAMSTMVASIRRVIDDANMLSAAAVDGDLARRADPSRHQGDFRAIVVGVNATLDAVVGPLAVAAEYVDRISKGDIPARIGDGAGAVAARAIEFKGDFKPVKDNLNLCIDTLNRLLAEMKAMHAAKLAGETDSYVDEKHFEGAYRQMVAGVNEVVRSQVDIILSILEVLGAYADGDLNPTLRRLPGKQVIANERLDQLRGNLKALIAEVGALTEAAVRGRLDARAEAARFAGDYRRIVEGVNRTLDNFGGPLRETFRVLEKTAQRDLTVRIEAEFPGDFGALKKAVNSVIDQMGAAVKRIAESTTTLAAASEELSASSEQMAGTAEETSSQANVVSAASEQVSKNVQVVATSAEEMSSSVKEIAKSATEAARVAGSAMQLAEGTTRTIGKLGQSSIEIGQVIKVITSIAQQTNLLALNATIEAARAGEAGKGFAVVANEVKELAKETAKATEDISRKIEMIQSDTGSAVSAVEQIGAVIKQINDIQATIASAVEEQSATTSSIEHNVAEAAKATNEIAKNITGVAQAAGQTAHGASGTQSASAGLSKMAADLQQLVGEFRVV